MTLNLKPYSAYKDSGVPWLGEVPEHWHAYQLGRIGRFSKGSGGTKEDEVPHGVPCIRYGDIYTQHQFFVRKTRAHVSKERAHGYTPIQYGDVLFAGSGETIEEIGKSVVNLMQSEALCGGDVIVFRPSIELEAQFMGYASDCRQAAFQKSCMGRGITVMHLYGDELKYMWVSLPPVPEQRAIVRYLNNADRRIRRYIRAKQRMTKLLEEHGQVIVQSAVTKGFDSNVRFRPSGVEWLGNVPEHWLVRKLSSVATVFNGTTPSRAQPAYWEGGTIPWLASGKVNDYVITGASELITGRALDECSLSLVPCCSVVVGLVGHGKTRGMSALLEIEATINQNLAAIVPRSQVSGRYLHHFLTAFYKPFRDQGRGGNQEALNCEIVGRFPISLPPVTEQEAICDRIEAELATLLQSQRSIHDQIVGLREYRACLIADVVTGKVDVREVAARLPEEVEDAEGPEWVDEPTGETADGTGEDEYRGEESDAE